MVARVVAVFVIGLVTLFPAATQGQRSDLGRISFENSGAAEAQGPFIDGVLLLHSFEYEDAAEAFRRAQQIDPGFALAHWGEAMTYNHPIWMQQDRDAALEALGRLGATPAERRAKAATEREKRYMDALEVLYGEGAKQHRDDRYVDVMKRLHEAYPEDQEAAVFYALALLGTSHEGRDFTTYMLAASVVQPVFEANPKHPGAAHMLIHSFDDPIHAPLGLPAAVAYSEIAPGAAHAQHMTSHIFVARGMWDHVVGANEVARDVQDARQVALGRRETACGHYTSWLEYGYLQQGRFDDARAILETCVRRIDDNPDAGERNYYWSMLSMYAVDTEDWGSVAELSRGLSGSPRGAWLEGYQAVMTGDIAGARSALSKMPSNGQGLFRAATLELEGLIEVRAGDVKGGLALLVEAAELEASLPFEFGPPRVALPTYEALGDALLRTGDAAAAEEAYRTQLGRTPQRSRTLRGLAAAAEAEGDRVRAAEIRAGLGGAWAETDDDA